MLSETFLQLSFRSERHVADLLASYLDMSDLVKPSSPVRENLKEYH